MNVRRRTLVLPVVLLLLPAAGCADEAPPAPPAASESPVSTPATTPEPPPPDLTDELIAKHATGAVRWAREGELVTFPDGSTGILSRVDGAPVLTVTVDGAEMAGDVPDHHAEGGLGPRPLPLDSGGVGYVVHQGGGEFAALNLMVVRADELVSVGQACFDIEANAYEAC